MASKGDENSIVPFYFATFRRVRHYLLPQVWRFRGPANLVLASEFFQNVLTELETGVYVGWAQVETNDSNGDGTVIHKTVVNVGYSPTFVQGQENPEKIIEAHLMPEQDTVSGDFYGQTMRLELLAYLRPEQKFASFPDLIAQIRADAQDAKDALDNHPVLVKAREDTFFSTPDWAADQTNNQDEVTSSWERKI
jgi:riboflavin kinase